MANCRREQAPEVAAYTDHPAPVVTRLEGLTGSTALAALGAIFPGFRRFILSKGGVSAGDTILWGLDQAGPVEEAFISTWTVSPPEIKTLRRCVDGGRIRRLRLLMDFSFANRHPAYCAELRATFGPEVVALSVCHAKLAVLVNESWAIVVRSSGNLNKAFRTEYYEASDDRGLAEFIVATLGKWFPPAADQWTVPVAEHKRRFNAWGEPGPLVGPGDARRSGADVQGVDRRSRVLRPATAADEPFFEDTLYGRDLRRVGLSYAKG
jgi:hypothetical protein